MKTGLGRLGFGRLLAVTMVILVCVGMWGCSDDVSFEWERTRRNAKVVGFVDDSLVMVGDYRFWLEVTDSWNGEHLEESGAGNPRLCVYNYRVQEEGPRWCDSVAERNNSGWFGGQLTDSIIWGGNLDKYYTLWKIGETPHKLDMKSEFEGCSKKINVKRMHEWLDGTFIALGSASVNGKTLDDALLASDYGSEYCQYAILDTVEKKIIYKRLDSELKWIKRCDDVRAWGKDILCLLKNVESKNVLMYSNAKVKDSLSFNDYKNYGIYPDEFMGNMLRLGHYICSLNNGEMSENPSVRSMITEIKFIGVNNEIISY